MSAFSGGGKKDFDGVGWAGTPKLSPVLMVPKCGDRTSLLRSLHCSQQ